MKSIVWLAGVRRSGKTTLAKQLQGDDYFNLANPSQVLKIAADEFPRLRVLATGSSTLAATTKFSDQLTDRKRRLFLPPVLPEECEAFGIKSLNRRLLHGGLPPALLSDRRDLDFYTDWMDSFYARDIQELFRVEKRKPFVQLLELLFSLNGTLVEPSKLAAVVGLSRPTIIRYFETLETTHAIAVLRPFASSGRQEIVSQAKVYGFDTGFVCFAKQIQELRPDDRGPLLENLALESLLSTPQGRNLRYWRTKQRQEIDFVVPVSRKAVHTVECKWKRETFDPSHLKRFREDYPSGRNYLVCSDAPRIERREYKGLPVTIVPIWKFRETLARDL